MSTMSRFTPPFSVTQQKVLAIVPKVTSTPSILGSICILMDILRLGKTSNTKRTVYHRLLFVMAFMDLLFACKSFVSTWPIPQETLFVWGNIGSFSTCDIAGFIGHGASLTSSVYNASLAVYFALTIVGNYTEQTAPTMWKWLEPLLHFVPWAIGWVTAAILLPLDYYNPIGWTCWIGTFPPGCGSEVFPCTRGDADRVEQYRWAFYHAQLWTIFAIAGTTLFGIWYSVKRREQRMLQYNFRHSLSTNATSRASSNADGINNNTTDNTADPTQEQHDGDQSQEQQLDPNDDSRSHHRPTGGRTTTTTDRRHHHHQQRHFQLAQRVATQAILYQFCFFLTWIFPMIQFVVSFKTGDLYFPIIVLTVIFTPLQGFFDALIYFRPRYLRYRQQQRHQRHQNNHNGPDHSSSHNSFMARRIAILQALSQPPDHTTPAADRQHAHYYEGEIIYADDGDTVVGAWESHEEDDENSKPRSRSRNDQQRGRNESLAPPVYDE